MFDKHIISVEDKDPVRLIENFVAELSETLLQHEKVGEYIMSTYEKNEDKIIFKTGYVAALLDYHIAVMAGRIGKIDYRLGIDGTEIIPE